MAVTARHAQSRKSRATPRPPGPSGGIMIGDQPVAVSAADADAAFGVLYAEHGPALLRLATALAGGDRGRAEDLVQETMLRAWTHRHHSDFQYRSPRAWLMAA